MTMWRVMGCRRCPVAGALILLISCGSLTHATDGFLLPSNLASRRGLISTRAKMDGKDCDASQSHAPSSPFRVDRRSALAIGAAAALAPLSIPILPACAAARSVPSWTLENGVEFPILALNTAGMSTAETEKAIEFARKEGITHVDFHPGKERDGMANYLAKHTGEREKFFLNTKIRKPPPGTSSEDAAKLARDQIDEDLGVLGVDHVDMLMLRDSPDSKVIQAQWAVVEEALAAGRCRSVGVINYCPSALKAVLATAKVTPAINYIMAHAGMKPDLHGLRTLSEKSGIRIFSYGQTGEIWNGVPGPNADLVDNPILKRTGAAHGGKSAGEVSLRWVLQSGMGASLRPSANFGRCEGRDCALGLARQARCLEWTLTDGEMAEIDAMTAPDDNPTLFSSAGCPGAFGTTGK